MKTLYNISVGIRKLIAFPFKLVGITFIALGTVCSIGINGILFPEETATKIQLLKDGITLLKDIKDETKEETIEIE